MAVALSCVTEPIAAAVPGTSFLTAVLSDELLIAQADPFSCVTDPIAAAVLRTELLAAVLTEIRLITDTPPAITAPVATAEVGAGGAGAVTALPALCTLTAAGLIEEHPVTAALCDTWPQQHHDAQQQGWCTERKK